MGLFSRSAKNQLGTGVWRRANDRFVRSLDRFHQILDGVDDDATYNSLVVIGNELVPLADSVYELCQWAQARAPSETMDIPPGMSDIHRCLSKASNALASVAETVAMVRLLSSQKRDYAVELNAVRFRAQLVHNEIAAADVLRHRMTS